MNFLEEYDKLKKDIMRIGKLSEGEFTEDVSDFFDTIRNKITDRTFNMKKDELTDKELKEYYDNDLWLLKEEVSDSIYEQYPNDKMETLFLTNKQLYNFTNEEKENFKKDYITYLKNLKNNMEKIEREI